MVDSIITQGNKKTNPGHFFCQACLESQAPKRQSSDPRYCNSCFSFLKIETLRYTNRPPWAPRDTPVRQRARKDKSINATIKRLKQRSNGGNTNQGSANNSTHPETNSSGVTKRGPKPILSNPLKEFGPPPKNPYKRLKPINLVDDILKLSKAGRTERQISSLTKTPKTTVHRILLGQGSLM